MRPKFRYNFTHVRTEGNKWTYRDVGGQRLENTLGVFCIFCFRYLSDTQGIEEDEIDEILNDLDRDGDGKITYEEFLSMITMKK